MSTFFGTSCFPSEQEAALFYYRGSEKEWKREPKWMQKIYTETVKEKLAEKAISIGKPTKLADDDEVVVIDHRYHIKAKL